MFLFARILPTLTRRFIRKFFDQQRMIIVVTGTPGTGKTSIAMALAKRLQLRYLDVSTLIEDYRLQESYDAERDTFVVDEKKLCRILAQKIALFKNVIIDSHLAHELSPSLVDYCLVTSCQLKTLQKRLQARGYSQKKIRENLDAEIFEVCLCEAIDAGHKILRVDTSEKTVAELVEDVSAAICQNKG